MSEQKKERSPSRRIGIRHNSSKRLARMAAKKEPSARSYGPGPRLPIVIGSQLLGYLGLAIRSKGFEALTSEEVSLGLFPDAMPAIRAIFEQLFPESKSN